MHPLLSQMSMHFGLRSAHQRCCYHNCMSPWGQHGPRLTFLQRARFRPMTLLAEALLDPFSQQGWNLGAVMRGPLKLSIPRPTIHRHANLFTMDCMRHLQLETKTVSVNVDVGRVQNVHLDPCSENHLMHVHQHCSTSADRTLLQRLFCPWPLL